MMIAFPCSTSSIARFFDATSNDGGDRGPPIIRDYDNPDGLPENQIDPKHVRELRNSNKLLERTVELAIAARLSPSRTVIIFENPADRSPGASIVSAGITRSIPPLTITPERSSVTVSLTFNSSRNSAAPSGSGWYITSETTR